MQFLARRLPATMKTRANIPYVKYDAATPPETFSQEKATGSSTGHVFEARREFRARREIRFVSEPNSPVIFKPVKKVADSIRRR